MNTKWRPSLALVIGGALAGTLILSLLGLIALRYLGPEIGFREAATLLAVAIAAITAIPGWLLVRLLLRPISALQDYAARQKNGEGAAVPRHYGTKEIDATARGVIAMAEALRNREASIRAYSDHVTHELKTPVSAIKAAAELLADSPDLSKEDRLLLDQISGAREQLETQLAALRVMAQARETRYLGQCRVADAVEAVLAQHPMISIRVDGGETRLPLAVEGLKIALGHLVSNAREHQATELHITASENKLLVQDNGAGVSPGNADRIFDPFFTTKRDIGGTGMGLSVVRNILQAHRGDIALIAPSSGQRGTGFRITFEPR